MFFFRLLADYQDNWTTYWLSDVPFEQLLVKWIHAKTKGDVKVKEESEGNNNKLWGSLSKLLPHACNHLKYSYILGFGGSLVCSILPFPPLHLSHSSQVSIAPRQTWWFIVAIHLSYSSITGRLLGDHGSSCLLLSSTEGPSVSGGRWKALRTRRCHAE